MCNENTRSDAEGIKCLQCKYCREDTELAYYPVYRCRKYLLPSGHLEIHLYSGEGGNRMNWCPLMDPAGQNLISDVLFEKGTRTFLGYDACKTNVLAERDDSVVKSLCYDA